MHYRILRLPEVINTVALSRSSIYKKVQDLSFPAPIKLSERAIGWRSDVIEDWLANRTNESKTEV
jgi:prophage regulatory protein